MLKIEKKSLHCIYCFFENNKQLLDQVEQNIVICQWRADSLFAEAKYLQAIICSSRGGPCANEKERKFPSNDKTKYTAFIFFR